MLQRQLLIHFIGQGNSSKAKKGKKKQPKVTFTVLREIHSVTLAACCQLLWNHTLTRQFQANHSLCSIIFFGFYLFHWHWKAITDSGSWRHYVKPLSHVLTCQGSTCSSKASKQLKNLNCLQFPIMSHFKCELKLFSPEPCTNKKFHSESYGKDYMKYASSTAQTLKENHFHHNFHNWRNSSSGDQIKQEKPPLTGQHPSVENTKHFMSSIGQGI